MLELIIKLFKQRFAQMVFEHKRERLSLRMQSHQKAIAKVVTVFSHHAQQLARQEEMPISAVQAYIDVMKSLDACFDFSETLVKHLAEENSWYSDLNMDNRTKLPVDFFEWHTLCLNYIESTAELTNQMFSGADRFFEALGEYPEQQEKMQILLQGVQEKIEDLDSQISTLTRV